MEGSPIGTSVLYFNDGTVYKKVRYSNTDLRVMEVYSQSGENLVKNGNGPSREYDSDQDIIESGKYENGLKQGPWIAERASDQKYYTENYDKGKLTTGLSYNVEGDEFVYSKILEAPTFKGGLKKMYKFINRNIHYPITPQKARISGKVITVFEIMSDGSIGRTYLLQKIQDDVDKEAIDIINKMSGKWVPGKVRGQFQKVSFTLPITFELPTNHRIETFGKSQTPKAMQF
jgi:TonB family protein